MQKGPWNRGWTGASLQPSHVLWAKAVTRERTAHAAKGQNKTSISKQLSQIQGNLEHSFFGHNYDKDSSLCFKGWIRLSLVLRGWMVQDDGNVLAGDKEGTVGLR